MYLRKNGEIGHFGPVSHSSDVEDDPIVTRGDLLTARVQRCQLVGLLEKRRKVKQLIFIKEIKFKISFPSLMTFTLQLMEPNTILGRLDMTWNVWATPLRVFVRLAFPRHIDLRWERKKGRETLSPSPKLCSSPPLSFTLPRASVAFPSHQ